MEFLIGMLIFFFIVITILVNIQYRRAKREKRNVLYTKPNLGAQRHTIDFNQAMKRMITHLDEALAEDYVEQVKERVVREEKINLTEWENRWFEWKRYLVMITLLKEVPMYSRGVDSVWHEMLMFTREYNLFSEHLLGETLHHIPNTEPENKANLHDRAWFDLIYVILFQPTQYSHLSWGEFFQHVFPEARITEFRQMNRWELKKRYFNQVSAERFSSANQLIDFLIDYIQTELDRVSEQVNRYDIKKDRRKALQGLQQTNREAHLNHLSFFLYLSWYGSQTFDSYNTSSNTSPFYGGASGSDGGSSDGGGSGCSGGSGGCGGGGGA